MRYIENGEKCLTAAEIAEMFEAETGVEFHPTNVGQAAKMLDLDYLEVNGEDVGFNPDWGAKRKLYSEKDIPNIFNVLMEKAWKKSAYDSNIRFLMLEYQKNPEKTYNLPFELK